MADLPTGTITFLFTDIEGSTRLWEAHPEAMRLALLQHDDLLRACIESHGGRVFKTVGDAFCALFVSPRRAVEAVLASQQRLPALALNTPDGPFPLTVRMALHTGVVEERDSVYFGPPLNRVARLLAIGLLPAPACGSWPAVERRCASPGRRSTGSLPSPPPTPRATPPRSRWCPTRRCGSS